MEYYKRIEHTRSQIVRDWKGVFPLLKSYTPVTLRLKTPIMMVGLRLDKTHFSKLFDYTPYLEILPLWKRDSFFLNYSLITIPIYRRCKTRGTYHITCYDHIWEFKRASEDAKIQFGALLREQFSIGDLFETITDSTTFEKGSYGGGVYTSYYRADLLELRLALALYFEDREMMDDAKAAVERDICKWGPERFVITCLSDRFDTLDEWKEALFRKFEDRDAFMAAIRSNLKNIKVARLNAATLVNDYAEYKSACKRKRPQRPSSPVSGSVSATELPTSAPITPTATHGKYRSAGKIGKP